VSTDGKARCLVGLGLPLLLGGAGYCQEPLGDVPVERGIAHDVAPERSFGPLTVKEGPLRAELTTERSSFGDNNLILTISNASDDFWCLAPGEIDTVNQRVRLLDEAGRDVPLRSWGERGNPPPETILGFDYNDAYTFILPREKRQLPLNLGNFVVSSGAYRYEMIFIYYRCRDAIDSDRIKEHRVVQPYAVVGKGSIVLPLKK
jgi:hypothetical protein